MLKFDFNAISDFAMYLENEKIITETPSGKEEYNVEDWKSAYSEFFIAVASVLCERDDWAYCYDFSSVKEDEYSIGDCSQMPTLINSCMSSNVILRDFEELKKSAYSRAYDTAKTEKSEKKSKKSLPENKHYDEIVDQIAYCAMQRVWYLYLEKKLTVEQARDESVSVFREYRRLRLLLTALEDHERRIYQTYQRQLDIHKRTAGMYAHLINNIYSMSDPQLIDSLIDLICLQNGENVSGDVIRRKIERKRISNTENENPKTENENPDLSLAI